MIREGGICMRCNKGQMAMYEFLLILVLMGTAGWVFYLYAHKPSESQIYQSGSKPIVQQPEYTSHFGCNNVKIDEFYEEKLHDRNVNSQINRT